MNTKFTLINLLILSVFLLFATEDGQSQVPEYEYTHTSTTNNSFPFNSATTNRRQFIYYPSNFPGAPSGLMTSIYVKITATSVNFTNFLVLMGPTTLNDFTPGPFYTTGMDTVFFATNFTPNVLPGNWMEIPLQVPFFYNSSENFVLDLSQEGYNPGTTLPLVNTGVINRTNHAHKNATTANTMDRLAQFGFDLLSGSQDAGITEILSPTGICGHPFNDFSVQIMNFGIDSITDIPVTGIVSGSITGTFNYTYTDTLAPGHTAIVSLGNLNTEAGGTFEVTVYTSLPSDTTHFNDTVTASFNMVATPQPPVTTSPVAGCMNEPIDLIASASTPDFQWFNAHSGGVLIASGSPATVTFDKDTILYVETLDQANQCPSERVQVILTISELYVEAGMDTGICYLEQIVLGSNPTATGQNPPFSYSWTPSVHLDQDNVANPLFTGQETTQFTVAVTDNTGCTIEREVTVMVSPELGLEAVVTDELCAGKNNGSISVSVLGGMPPFRYLWENNSPFPNRYVLGEGSYSITVTDKNDCQISANYQIEAAEPLLVTSEVKEATIHGKSDGSIHLDVSGGNPPYSFLWSHGVFSQNLNNVIAGTYSVVVSDANGCEHTESFNITQWALGIQENSTLSNLQIYPNPAGANFNIEFTNSGNADISIEVFDVTGRKVYSILKSNTGDIKHTINVEEWAAGTYLVRITTGDSVVNRSIVIAK